MIFLPAAIICLEEVAVNSRVTMPMECAEQGKELSPSL